MQDFSQDNATLSGTLMETVLVGEYQYYFHSSITWL